jgi:nicotinate-nucleotide--dimethylbenzimidazole phosphoribosyltransferase
VTEGSAGARLLGDVISSIAPLDARAEGTALARLDQLTKPPGSLGRLEAIAVQLAGIRGSVATIERPAVVIFAGDHDIARQAVSPYPSEVTRQMIGTYLRGGAAINVLADAAGAELVVVDVGVAGPPIVPTVAAARLIVDRIRSGARDFSCEPALTREETIAAVDVGRRVVDELATTGVDVIGVGEMGIGNTTASSAIVASLTGRPVLDVTGRGAGLDDNGVHRKAELIDLALQRHRPDPSDPIGVVTAVGGLEIAALVGAILAAGSRRIPVVLDGFITGAAALLASRLAPNVAPRLIAGHLSVEPGHRIVLDELGLEPILDLDLRLGEGSGAALAIPTVRAAARILVEMSTFDEAGVTNRD